MKKILGMTALAMMLAFFATACSAAAGEVAAAPAATAAAATAAATTTADTAAASTAVPESPKGTAADGTLELTLEQLKQYDGKNGNPAYVAVDGIIYDLTNVPAWKNGEHNGYSAGNDLTDIIKNKSPHGLKNLEGKPVVGKLVAG